MPSAHELPETPLERPKRGEQIRPAGIGETVYQSTQEQQRAVEQSKRRSGPPAEPPGYEVQRFLGAGTFGQVWVGTDRNTGRSVAIKFFTRHAGLDWPLLAREVEKLAFLAADRYVVQLLDVGWDADPPYYVMEYVERGSLEAFLKTQEKISVEQIVACGREVAQGLLHAHAKGVLHCDVKPANILLDQDGKPRLADFGQSRLTHEQTPSLGTLFYMAPEQADLGAAPDARWDVYALGALLYRMLTGHPPFQTEEALANLGEADGLDDRLARYRQLLHDSPPPNEHRRIAGVDQALGDIVSRCLERHPKRRYPNIQAVLNDLDLRAQRRAKRPLLVLGAAGPAFLLMLMVFFAYYSFQAVLARSREALVTRALESDRFAAEYVASAVTNDLERRYLEVERLANDPEFLSELAGAIRDPELSASLTVLADPQTDRKVLDQVRGRYLADMQQRPDCPVTRLQERVRRIMQDPSGPPKASWLVFDPLGNQLARWPVSDTIGRNYAWRAYFHGGEYDREPNWRPAGVNDILSKTELSPVFHSEATRRWIVAISTPVRQDGDLLGVTAMTFEVGKVADLPGAKTQFPVLVNLRAGKHQGLILEHPLFARYPEYPLGFMDADYLVTQNIFPDTRRVKEDYRDPLAKDPAGKPYSVRWLADHAPVKARGVNTGWEVIVQESYEEAIGATLQEMLRDLIWIMIAQLSLFAVVVTALWGFVLWSYAPAGWGGRWSNRGRFDSLSSSEASSSASSAGSTDHGGIERKDAP